MQICCGWARRAVGRRLNVAQPCLTRRRTPGGEEFLWVTGNRPKPCHFPVESHPVADPDFRELIAPKGVNRCPATGIF